MSLLYTKCTERIQMTDVVAIARMVPMGMDFWASLKSPDRFEPAMIPGQGGGVTRENQTFRN